MRIRGWNLPAIIFAIVVMGMAAQFPAAAESGVTEKDGIKIIVLEGTPREMGIAHGELMKETITEVYDTYLHVIVYDEWIKQFAMMTGNNSLYKNPEKKVTAFSEKVAAHIPEEYIEEMKGLAEGAGLKYTDVMNMMTHVDFLATMFCSTVVASGPASADGKLVEGRNLDWVSGKALTLDKHSAVLVFKPENGHSFVSVLYPGVIGALTAVNDAGITVELNFSLAEENAGEGLPAMLMVRQIAQYAASLDDAQKLLEDAPRLAGYNIMVTDGKTNDARLFEITASAVGVKKLGDDGVLVSTNHFITEEQSGKNKGTTRGGGSTYLRFDRLNELAKEHYGKMDTDMAMNMIHDDGVKVDSTMQTVVFKPADGVMRVWSRNRAPMDFVEFDVFELLGKNLLSPN